MVHRVRDFNATCVVVKTKKTSLACGQFRPGHGILEPARQIPVRTMLGNETLVPSHIVVPLQCVQRLRAAGPALTQALSTGTAVTTGPGLWWFLALALVMAAALAYLLGRAWTARQGQHEVLKLRQQLRELRAKQASLGGYRWQSDAEHALVEWVGPDQSTQTSCPLFLPPTDGGGDAAAALELQVPKALQAQLQAQQGFGGLRVRANTAWAGSKGWELRGAPQHDETGRFVGFVGSARPTDDEDGLRAAAALLMPTLRASPAPTVLAWNRGQGWNVADLNPAARLRWPALLVGSPIAQAASAVPQSLLEALDNLDSSGSFSASHAPGWRLEVTAPLPFGERGAVLLLALQPGSAAASPEVAVQAGASPNAAADGTEGAGNEMDSFSFTVSHDLRAPIRVVEGFTRIVKEDYGHVLDRVGNDHLDRVLGAAARMNLMIDALLALARLSTQPLARQPVNLSQLAGYVVDELRRSAPQRDADVDIQAGLVTQGDPTLLRLVLENLLGNAWKYSARSARAQISLRTVQHGEQVAYVVRDNGAGFDMRSAERLFGLFQRLHSASDFPGHGVGLASVQRIVRRHGGQIWAEAEPGRGAAFYFTLKSA
jgi:signal transduction histidine kinase